MFSSLWAFGKKVEDTAAASGINFLFLLYLQQLERNEPSYNFLSLSSKGREWGNNNKKIIEEPLGRWKKRLVLLIKHPPLLSYRKWKLMNGGCLEVPEYSLWLRIYPVKISSLDRPTIVVSFLLMVVSVALRKRLTGESINRERLWKLRSDHQTVSLRREMWSVPCFQPDRIPSTIGSLSCLAVTFTTQQINS